MSYKTSSGNYSRNRREVLAELNEDLSILFQTRPDAIAAVRGEAPQYGSFRVGRTGRIRRFKSRSLAMLSQDILKKWLEEGAYEQVLNTAVIGGQFNIAKNGMSFTVRWDRNDYAEDGEDLFLITDAAMPMLGVISKLCVTPLAG